ncbi:hypothetical protein RF55_22762, partial [Lasius niger]
MNVKMKLGMGLKSTTKTKKKTSKKRILPVAKRGGVLPILPILGALGSLIGGAAGVAKAVNDRKAAQRQLQKILRHNRAMEGRGLYLARYKHGRELSTRKKNVKETLKMPQGVTTNVQLLQLTKRMRIPFFRGVFMRDSLLIGGIYRIESGIVNLDNTEGPDTHW